MGYRKANAKGVHCSLFSDLLLLRLFPFESSFMRSHEYKCAQETEMMIAFDDGVVLFVIACLLAFVVVLWWIDWDEVKQKGEDDLF
jgi:hypothetical protein